MAKKSRKKKPKTGGPIPLKALTVYAEALAPDGTKILTTEGVLDASVVQTPWQLIYDQGGGLLPLKVYLDPDDFPTTGCRLLLRNSGSQPAFAATVGGLKSDCTVTIQLEDRVAQG